MPPNRTKTIKNKHAAPKGSGGKGGKGAADKKGGGAGGSSSGGSGPRPKKPKGPVVSQQLKEKNRAALYKRPKKKVYTEKELGIPALNMITPVGVVKPKGQKKGKVFVDDKESMTTILSLVQAEKEGHIESKMIKARQLEEIREARRAEAEKKADEKKARLEDAKDALRKKRKRGAGAGKGDEGESLKSISQGGTRAGKPRKRVAFA
ncbi:60S ribosomal subunit assembly/export protein LOC1 [Escovopsis weberi]|uniref:60S ribosomal subunit assembly/export protein LOC1 n=1 Tax=Escovopsis weberi TaxID=150374 RepID=A0A0M8MUV0_ESCWE|nr:60S ribosomal subunit assembly/export protein LOC1 [Escovopsis weberi]